MDPNDKESLIVWIEKLGVAVCQGEKCQSGILMGVLKKHLRKQHGWDGREIEKVFEKMDKYGAPWRQEDVS